MFTVLQVVETASSGAALIDELCVCVVLRDTHKVVAVAVMLHDSSVCGVVVWLLRSASVVEV
jgi:hypothetical protein